MVEFIWWLLSKAFVFVLVPVFAAITLLLTYGNMRAARQRQRDDEAGQWVSRSDDWTPDRGAWDRYGEPRGDPDDERP